MPPILSTAEMARAANLEKGSWRPDWHRCRRHTLVPAFRALLAYRAVQRVDEQHVPGDIVEAGVWHGGLSCLMARAHQRQQRRRAVFNRTSWLMDTFSGMPAPNRTLDGWKANAMYERFRNGSTTGLGCRVEAGKWCFGSFEMVSKLMDGVAGARRTRYVRGKVEDTLLDERELPRQIAVLRLDTDWYTSTLAELDVLWPRLSPGGWLYIDDYFDFAGCAGEQDLAWLPPCIVLSASIRPHKI